MTLEIFEIQPEGFISQLDASACSVECGSQILLLKRSAHVPEGNTWGLPAGKMEKGETPILCAVRELWEETGIVIRQEDLQNLGRLFIRKPQVAYTFHHFHIKMDQKPSVILSHEHVDFRWVSGDEMKKMHLIAGGKEALDIYFRRKNQGFSDAH